MNLYHYFLRELISIVDSLVEQGKLPDGLDSSRISVDPPRDSSHGDLATNAAMVLAKPAGMKPRDVAEILKQQISQLNSVESVDIAGPGFINLSIASAFWYDRMNDILDAGPGYGDSELGQDEAVNVEFVSANPTGPLHVAHARGAIMGDALSNLLRKAGYNVTSEFYINDAGAQVDTLARSTHLRYREALGEDIGEIPEGFYPGDYLIPVGQALARRDGDKWVKADEAEWLPMFRQFAVNWNMEQVKKDLAQLGIQQDVFTSEAALVNAGAVEDVVSTLEDMGLVYTGVLEPPKGKTPDDWEPRPQTLFKATQFGDDVDRPLKKSDGSYTYFTNDIANHLDKYRRGFSSMIDIFGADHGGYVKRMKAAVTAITGGNGDLDIKLCQMVHLKKNGEPMRMSKRAGTFVTLSDLIDEVGKDVVRFIMLTRKSDTQMEFDLQKVTEQSRDNPVFYVQYAHARCSSVLRKASEEFDLNEVPISALKEAQLDLLSDPAELDLIRCMASWPRMVEMAAINHEPHRIAYYLDEVATHFHSLWNKGKDDSHLRFIHPDNKQLTMARLALVQAVVFVIASGLDVFGVTPVEELR